MSPSSRHPACCHHGDICSIIPHYILQDMADNEENSDELRSRALKTARHMKSLRDQRGEHCRRLRTENDRRHHHAREGYGGVKNSHGSEHGSSAGTFNAGVTSINIGRESSAQTTGLDAIPITNPKNAPQEDEGIVAPTTFQDIVDSHETSEDQKAVAMKNLNASQTVRVARAEAGSDGIMDLGAPSDATLAALSQVGTSGMKGTVPVDTVPAKIGTTNTDANTPPVPVPATAPAPAPASAPAPSPVPPPTTKPTTPTSPTPTAPPNTAPPKPSHPLQINRTIFTSDNTPTLPGRLLLREGSPPLPDSPPANTANTHFHTTLTFLYTIFALDSLNNAGLPVLGNIDYDDASDPPGFINALWNGTRMLFGDGDGVVFTDFTNSLEVVAHELTHGVVQYTANLPYHSQSGALNEHIADAFGSMAKQWALSQPSVKADWLIGADLFLPQVRRRNPRIRALRDLRMPGTAFRGAPLGVDRQPAHMSLYVHLPDDEDPVNDSGGVHINSGILNRAFYLFCVAVGGNSWEIPGRIWFAALVDPGLAVFAGLPGNYGRCFGYWAESTCRIAAGMFGDGDGDGGDVVAKLRRAWVEVGVLREEDGDL